MMSERFSFLFFMPCSNKSMLAAHLSFSSLLLVPIPLLIFGSIFFPFWMSPLSLHTFGFYLFWAGFLFFSCF